MTFPFTAKAVTGAFLVSGTIHLVKPKVFEPIVPEQVPGSARQAVLWSGVAELALAVGLLNPRTRKLAAYGSAALLAGVLPANVKMAADAQKSNNLAFKAATVARIPLQAPMIRAMLKVARSA